MVSDEVVALPAEAKSVLTGADQDTGPGEKRDVGMHAAGGEYLAFIDDDAAPRADWLSNAVRIFEDQAIGAVAGPGVTPPASGWAERAGGAFYESWLGSGPFRYRFRPGRPGKPLIARAAASAAPSRTGCRT